MTTGPWLEVGPLPILDVSIQLDHEGEGPVALWAVGSNGDVLCRVGVTTTNPKVCVPLLLIGKAMSSLMAAHIL